MELYDELLKFERYKILAIDAIRDRGVPVLYRGEDGYLHTFTGKLDVRMIDEDGNSIQPATEETLSDLRDDFNTKIPSPFSFDSNGRVYVNAYLENADIEIGAVEIKDGDTNTRAKIDDDNAIRAGIYNTNGNRINPATEDTLNSFHNDFNTKIPSPLHFDANGNLKVYMENPTIAYDSNADLFKESIERDNVGLAKDATISSTLPRNITEIAGKALTPADWTILLTFIPALGEEIANEMIVSRSLDGTVWIANDYENGIANNDYVYYLIDATQLGDDKDLLIKFIDIHAEGDLLVQIYQNPDITDAGENISIFNAYDDSDETHDTKITKYPSWNNMGTLIETIYIAGNGNYAFPTKIFENRFITKKYLIAIKNVSGNNLQHITFSVKFVEADFEINLANFLSGP